MQQKSKESCNSIEHKTALGEEEWVYATGNDKTLNKHTCSLCRILLVESATSTRTPDIHEGTASVVCLTDLQLHSVTSAEYSTNNGREAQSAQIMINEYVMLHNVYSKQTPVTVCISLDASDIKYRYLQYLKMMSAQPNINN